MLDLVWIFACLDPDAAPPGAAPDEADVQALVARARSGDRDAAAALYRLHAPRVFRTVRAMTRSDSEAEDVVQETFVRALDAIVRYEQRGDVRFVSWLLAIATNVVRKRARRLRLVDSRAPDVLEAEADPAVGADETLVRAQNKRALLAALAELTERERALLSLRYGGELNASEIAPLVDMTPANVRKTCERLRARLLARLGEAEEHSEEARP